MNHIAVAGAGLVGCLLSTYLAREGFNVTIFDRMADPRVAAPQSNRSISITVSARGFRALDEVGLGDAVRRTSIPIYGRMIHGEDGCLIFQPYSTGGEANYAIRRQDLLLILLNFADQHENIRFVFDHKCRRLDLSTTTLTVQNIKTGQSKRIQADLLFGADGAFSRVRQAMQRKERFNYSQHFIDLAYREIVLPAPTMEKLSLDPNAFHIWPRSNLMLYGFADCYGDFTLSLVMPYNGPVSHETIHNHDALYHLLQTQFADVFSAAKPHVDDYFTKPVEPLLTIRCYPWIYDHRVALIGDACHAVLPFYGQGANAGFEDCYILLQCLKEQGGNWGPALQAYQEARKPNTDALADLCQEHAMVLMDAVDDAQFQLRKKIEHTLQRIYPERTCLYHNISFTCLPYTEAVHREQTHQQLVDRILQLPDIETKLDTPNVKTLLDPLLIASDPV